MKKSKRCFEMDIVYSKVKIFHFSDKLNSLPETENEIKSPIHVRIKPTNMCNHKCRYCAYKDETLQSFGKDFIQRTYIPKDKIMEIIDDLISMGVKAITFSGGGEPFMYPYLLDVVKKLAESPIRFAALTNGSLLRGETADIFAEYGKWVRVSMDGWDDESYSSYRDVPNDSFSKLMNNMESFKRLKPKCHLGVSYIIDQNNAPMVYDFLRNIKNVGVDSVKLSACLVSDKAAENNMYHKFFFSNVKDQIQQAIETLQGETFEIFDAYHELDEKFLKTYTWCPYLQILPVIGADLNVYSCPDKAYNLGSGLLGNIKEKTFKEFWFSDKKKFFKINPSINCCHHCETNHKNKLVLEYLDADEEHLFFV